MSSVTIQLTRMQVNEIVRVTSGAGNMSALLARLDGLRKNLPARSSQLAQDRLSRSLLLGLSLLAHLPSDGSWMGNTELARMIDAHPSTAHRYISTFVAVGVVERDARTRRYRLCVDRSCKGDAV
jgi:DNA-binding MarR family transcriptional regulator